MITAASEKVRCESRVQIALTNYFLIKTQAFIVSRDFALYTFLQFVVNIYLQKCKPNNPILYMSYYLLQKYCMITTLALLLWTNR